MYAKLWLNAESHLGERSTYLPMLFLLSGLGQPRQMSVPQHHVNATTVDPCAHTMSHVLDLEYRRDESILGVHLAHDHVPLLEFRDELV